MAFAFEAGRRARMRRNRAQKVVLACATFDPDGKIMLTTDGMFPCREITDSFHERVTPSTGAANFSLLKTVLTLLIPYFYGSSALLSTGILSAI